MHIPIPVAILCCISTAGIVWYFGTHSKDFVTPPTPADLVEVTEQWEESKPNIPPPQPINPALTTDNNQSPQGPTAPAPAPIQTIPADDPFISPSLAAYASHGTKGADAMIRHATRLETKGELQRALLAWERVIDFANPSEEERNLAAHSIKRLKPALPPWNPDPESEITITLRAGATLRDEKVLTSALQKVAGSISLTSGHTILVKTKASIGKSRNARTPRIPVAIWIARQAKGNQNTAETPPISFMADPTKEPMLRAQIEAGIYALVRTQLNKTSDFSKLPEYPQGAKPNELIQLHITRLMWRQFALSLKE